ncbi:hypothetical protein Mpt1_c01480 [Candidatus Methanoplasma termitum]|uniref:Tetratricopeptide repeat protein n=1 Tax=Candidatus Methanoplasma termitum TaxID=1577791 RepID=A0A0A7LEW3_9ARCH|nr:hypothetical protein [Candidatus Methanoplasma termitum]AIZ56051.1 hypothetical protein Mpt1_c01480 [Candidatus Methanoplasma termitum]MCL2333588.1 hypothetical protein [Candidatus Methanoplasma sp.]
MDEKLLIITDGLKGLNNSAIEMIIKGEYAEAERMFETIENTSRLFGYEGGIGMARLSLANVSILKGDVFEALAHIEVAECCNLTGNDGETVCSLHKKIALMALEVGIRMENSGELRDALDLFERIHPYLNEKRAVAVKEEILNLKEYLDGGGEP